MQNVKSAFVGIRSVDRESTPEQVFGAGQKVHELPRPGMARNVGLGEALMKYPRFRREKWCPRRRE